MATAIVPPELAALACLPDDALIGVDLVAAFYSCSSRHVFRSADAAMIPQPIRLGRAVRWRVGTIRQHIRDGCPALGQAGRAAR